MASKETVSALVAFSVPLVKSLSSHRLPPTYVGVPRRRPSSKEVQSAWRNNSDDAPPHPQVAFMVKDEDGTERRMTKKEKKETKRIMLVEKREGKRKRKAETLEKSHGNETKESNNKTDEDSTAPQKADAQPLNLQEWSKTSEHGNNYHQLQVSSAAVEEELADLRGDRDGVPPAALMPCMALQTSRVGISIPEPVTPSYELDDELAHTWATSLKESLKEAEEVRKHEDLRPVAYQLVPEVWKRMRPDLSGDEEITHLDTIEGVEWSWIPIRRRVDPLDSDKNIVCALLHSRSKLHISCGSKFGCDFLLYDGPRHERHAFAGLRILQDGETPRAYDLHGYVRCLNTAGKLSLLAKVDRQGECAKVAFVDLALEKILTAPRHAKRSLKHARRDVSKNLAKK